MLSRYMPQRKVRAVKNLLSSSEDSVQEEDDAADNEDIRDAPFISYYHPNLTLA